MADEISIIVKAEDQFSAVLGNFGNIMTGIKSTIDLVGMAFNTAKDFLQPFIDSASESELALVGLENVIHSTGLSAGLTEDSLIAMSSALQSVTRFSDEEIQSAEAMLLRFENLQPIMQDALELTLDYAASLGIDLTSAAQTMGKALDDPASGIGRLNMQFKLFNETEMDTIKQMAENGDIAGAQALIMDRLREKVGGAAEAFGNTFAGALDITKNKLDDIKETIGGPILDVLQLLLNKFDLFLDTNPTIAAVKGFFTDLKGLLDNNITPLAALGISLEHLSSINPIFQDLGEAIVTLQGYLTQGVNPLDAIKYSLDNLVQGDTPLAGIAQSIQDFITTGQTEGWGVAIGDLFLDILNGLKIEEKVQGFIDLFVEKISTSDWGAVTSKMTEIFTTVVGGVFSGLADIIRATDWGPIKEALKDALLGVGENESFWTHAADGFLELFAAAFGDPDIATFQAGVQAGAQRVWDFVYSFFSPSVLAKNFTKWFADAHIGDAIADGINLGLNTMTGGMWDVIVQSVNKMIATVKSILGISSPSSIFKGIAIDIIQGLIDGWNEFWDNFKALVTQGVADVLSIFGVNIGTSSTSGTIGGATSTFGGFGTGTTSTATNQTSQNVTNYFYGPVYFNQSTQDTNYDCPSPNPLMTAGSGTIVPHAL